MTLNISFERTKTGILAIAAAGIFAAGAVAERANRLYSPAPPDGAAAAGEDAPMASASRASQRP